MYIYIYVCVCVNICILTYIHTYIYIYIYRVITPFTLTRVFACETGRWFGALGHWCDSLNLPKGFQRFDFENHFRRLGVSQI